MSSRRAPGPALPRRWAAETFGTFALVFVAAIGPLLGATLATGVVLLLHGGTRPDAKDKEAPQGGGG